MNTDNEKLMVPYIVYESTLDKGDRQQRRMIYIIILLIILLVVTNLIWLIAWNQYDYIDVEDYAVDVNSEDGGNANYIGEGGNIYNGTGDSAQAKD